MMSIIASARHFANIHDELPAFHAAYLVLAFLAAGLFNLGAFAVLIVLHMLLDVYKYHYYHDLNWKLTFEGVFRESLIDIALLAAGLVFAVYLHSSVGLSGMSGLLRAEATIVRAAALLVPKLKILHDFLKVISHVHHYLNQTHRSFQRGLTSLDKCCLVTIALSVILIALTPELMNISNDTLLRVLAEEIVPWRLH